MRLAGKQSLVVDAAGRLADSGLGGGCGVSVRVGDCVVISPPGVPAGELVPDEVAIVHHDEEQVGGCLPPGPELAMHLAVYAARPDAGAVVHTHAPAATALSCVLDGLPCIHDDMLRLGGSVRVAPYAAPGSPELRAAVVAALEGRCAALLANHGTLALGGGPDEAVAATQLLEWASDLYARASLTGRPRALRDPAPQLAPAQYAFG